MRKLIKSFVFATCVLCVLSTTAYASCVYVNTTKYSFVGTYGNTSNLQIGMKSTFSAPSGYFVWKNKEAKGPGIAGHCTKGSRISVFENEEGILQIFYTRARKSVK